MMKKHILIMVLLLLLVGCANNTTEITTPTTLAVTTNLELEVPVIEREGDTIEWTALDGITEYQVYLIDSTPNRDNDAELYTYFTVITNHFDIESISSNKIFKVKVRSVDNGEYSLYSNEIVVDTFVASSVEYHYTFNINSMNNLVLEEDDLTNIYTIEINENFYNEGLWVKEEGLYALDGFFLKTYTEALQLSLYTNLGIIEMDIQYEDISKPYMKSNNTITFEGEDIVLVYELCGGEFFEINGSDISSRDYELVGNILTIDSDFVQDLFDENADRTSVILSYQLRNSDEIVIGYIFISR